MNTTIRSDFPKLGKLPNLVTNPHAELGRINGVSLGRLKCMCGSAAWVGQGIAENGDLLAQCFNCRNEIALTPTGLVN